MMSNKIKCKRCGSDDVTYQFFSGWFCMNCLEPFEKKLDENNSIKSASLRRVE